MPFRFQLKFEGFIMWQMLSNSATFSFRSITFWGKIVLDLNKTKISSDVQHADNNSNTRREVGDEGRCVITVKGHVNHSNTHNPHPHWCIVWTDKHGWTHTYHGAVVVLAGRFIVRNQLQPEVFQPQHLRTFILGMLHNAALGSARSPPERASWEDKRKVRGLRSAANAGTFSVELRSLREWRYRHHRAVLQHRSSHTGLTLFGTCMNDTLGRVTIKKTTTEKYARNNAFVEFINTLIGFSETCSTMWPWMWWMEQRRQNGRGSVQHIHPLIRCDACIITGSWMGSDRMSGIVVELRAESTEGWREYGGHYFHGLFSGDFLQQLYFIAR